MKLIIALFALGAMMTSACKKDDQAEAGNSPRTEVPAALQGSWMYGNFSTTEYWSQSPDSYLGNALEFAIAFTFEKDGIYTQYFTSRNVSGGVTSYQQSVTRGTVEIDPEQHTIRTHPNKAHYKRTRNGSVIEERDLTSDEITSNTSYTYTTGTEAGGTKALYLTLNGTSSPLTFLKK
ncbi:MAG TPA: hypothetical protein VHK91_15230 [Flavisolibacter sp.]|jgi:hypothetical protein|nr:hypothetical protein [Flavisolibacter sp.]